MREKGRFRFANISVRVMLGFLFAFVSIIPMLAIGYISIHTFSETVLERSIQQCRSKLELTQYRMVEMMQTKHRSMLIAAFNPNLRAYYEWDEERMPNVRSVVDNETKKQLIALFNSQEDAALQMQPLEGDTCLWKDVVHSNVREIPSTSAPIPLSAFRLFDLWSNPQQIHGEFVLPYSRIILNSENEPVAQLTLYVKESLFYQLYADYASDKSGEFYILNAQGSIFSSSRRDTVGEAFPQITGVNMAQLSGEDGYLRHDGSIYVYKAHPQRGFILVERVGEDAIMSGMRAILTSILYVALISLVLCVLLGTWMARSFTSPLYRLIDRIQPENAGGGSGAAHRNELAILSDSYDRIVNRLDTLIAEYYEEQRKKKEAEIRALEFQINPHFLYNTLSTIIWLIEAEEDKSAIRITKELAAFFRISISKSHENIPISEELKHVMLYTDIQSTRYEGIDFHVSVPDALRDFYTPKLVLQPLVENSIIHALQTNPDRTCRIEIRAYETPDAIVLEVCDDGKNITEDTIDDMNTFLHSRGTQRGKTYGIGISNVHDRIVMRYGEGYGLDFRRESGMTIARIRIRKTKGERAGV